MSEAQKNLKTFIKSQCLHFGYFTLSSGEKSRYYIDLRKLTLDGRGLQLVGEVLWEQLGALGIYGVAGEGLGAYPMVAAAILQAQSRGQSWKGCYVRKQPKTHGRGNQVEGVDGWPALATVAVLEDTCTTGGSLLKCCDSLEHAGIKAAHALTLVHRGGPEVAAQFKARGINFKAVFTREDILEESK